MHEQIFNHSNMTTNFITSGEEVASQRNITNETNLLRVAIIVLTPQTGWRLSPTRNVTSHSSGMLRIY